MSNIVPQTFGQNDCTICLDSFQEESVVIRLKCRHKFHIECLLEWGEEQQKCPHCREDFKMEELNNQIEEVVSKNSNKEQNNDQNEFGKVDQQSKLRLNESQNNHPVQLNTHNNDAAHAQPFINPSNTQQNNWPEPNPRSVRPSLRENEDGDCCKLL